MNRINHAANRARWILGRFQSRTRWPRKISIRESLEMRGSIRGRLRISTRPRRRPLLLGKSHETREITIEATIGDQRQTKIDEDIITKLRRNIKINLVSIDSRSRYHQYARIPPFPRLLRIISRNGVCLDGSCFISRGDAYRSSLD